MCVYEWVGVSSACVGVNTCVNASSSPAQAVSALHVLAQQNNCQLCVEKINYFNRFSDCAKVSRGRG